jgi:predicted esterase
MYFKRSKIIQAIFSIILLLFVVWIGSAFLLSRTIERLYFNPEPSKNQDYNFQYLTDFIRNKEGKRIEILYNLDNDKDIVLYLHGNTGRNSSVIEEILKNYNFVSPAYTGFSNSEGEVSANSIYEVVDLTIEWLKNQGIASNKIIVLGHSVGGSAALYASTKYSDLKNVILVNTFYSLQSECSRQFYLLCIFTQEILPSNVLGSDVKTQIRQFHTINDEKIPYSEGKKLFERIISPDKAFFDLTGNHDNFSVDEVLNER